MRNEIITGTIAATILIAGCGKQSASSPATPPSAPAVATSSAPVARPERAIVTKAKSIVLPEFKLDGVTLSEAVRQLSDAAKQNDPGKGKGINFMITEAATTATTAANAKITLALKSVTLKEVIDRVAEVAAVRVGALDYAFIFDSK
jgi:hypothetical protein